MTGDEKIWFKRIQLIQSQMIPISLIDNNTGQIPDVPANPRFIRDEKFEALKQSIMDDPEFLSFNEIKVYPLGGRYVDIGGNMRTRALKELGVKEAPCKVMPEDTPAHVLRSRIMKDNYGYGEYDQQILKEEWDLSELDDWDMDDIITFDKEDEDFFEETETDIHDDFDEEKHKKRPVFVESGDIWLLGNHRLMCGDSTDMGSVALLMDGEKADIAFTSPPYGASKSDNLRNHCVAGHSHDRKKFYDKHEDTIDGWKELVEKSYESMAANSVQQFINIQMLADNKKDLMNWVASHNDNLVDVIIWDKHHGTPQMNDNILNNRFEFIFVFGGDTRKLKFGDFKGNIDNVIDTVSKEQNKFADVHKAVFPIGLPTRILEINSKAKSVLDLFGGTGTTLIASQKMGVRAYLMELSEQYASIIINRYIEEVGNSQDVFLLDGVCKVPFEEVLSKRGVDLNFE